MGLSGRKHTDFDISVAEEKDIIAFHVSEYDVMAVKVAKSLRNLD
jgi:hypothetical protein